MGVFTERCFYTFIIVILAILAILGPILIIQLGKKHPQYVYLFQDVEGAPRPTKLSKKLLTSPPDRYYNLSELGEYLNNFVTRREILFSINAIGETEYFTNPIYEIGLRKKGDPKPMVLIVAGIQAKDWTSVYASIYMMHLFFADLRGTTMILEKFNFHFLPLLNPDGYHLSTTWPIYSNWVNNTGNYDETADIVHPQGHSVLYDFAQFSGNTEEAKTFKEYFNEHKSHIKAVCFLFSPTNVSKEGKYFQFSKEYLDSDDDRKKLLEDVASELSQDDSSFQYDQYLNEPSKHRIDKWISSTSSKPLLVMNFIADFGPHATETVSKISRVYARQIHNIITKVVTSLHAKFKIF